MFLFELLTLYRMLFDIVDHYDASCSKVYGSVSVCVECYSCSTINEVQVRVSI